jgi:flagellar motor switch protein FliG
MSKEGIRRSAILLMSIGEEEAIEVLKHLGPREVHKLGAAMAKLTHVSREQVAQVLRQFRRAAQQQTAIGAGSDEYVRSVLTKALGSERASILIDRILRRKDNAGIESLRWMDATAVAELIGNEHPQIIATVLVHLDSEQAAQVLGMFPEHLRNDVMLRIATLDGVQPSALRDLNEVLAQLLDGADRPRPSARGGVAVAAEILNCLGGTVEASVSAHLREADPDLVQEIEDQMFAFEDLLALDDRALHLLLREVRSDTLVVALKGASEELRQKIFQSMSQPAAQMLRDDLDAKGPVRLLEVEAEQREILRIVRRFAREGRIALDGRSEVSRVQ